MISKEELFSHLTNFDKAVEIQIQTEVYDDFYFQ